MPKLNKKAQQRLQKRINKISSKIIEHATKKLEEAKINDVSPIKHIPYHIRVCLHDILNEFIKQLPQDTSNIGRVAEVEHDGVKCNIGILEEIYVLSIIYNIEDSIKNEIIKVKKDSDFNEFFLGIPKNKIILTETENKVRFAKNYGE